jgi:acylphosphatase
MSIKETLKKARDNYVIDQVEDIKLPDFGTSPITREKVIFLGRVQNVGFRLEVFLLATRIGLTGWVKNTENGSVEAELQGEINRIEFLKDFMKSLKRARVRKMQCNQLETAASETNFKIL